MKSKFIPILVTALLTSLVLLGMQALLPKHAPDLTPSASAQNIVSGQFYGIMNDTFIITANSTGNEVFVYYFDAKPEQELSTIKFITRIKAP
jgi:hypothetical protein